MNRLDPHRWAEVKPGVVIVPCWRAASTALLQAVRLKQGLVLDARGPRAGLREPQLPDFAIHLREVPADVEFVIVGRDPVARLGSARSHLLSRPFVPAADWGTFLAWCGHTTDGHVVPLTRLIDRYFAGRPHRLVRIEDYRGWAPGFGLPAELPRVNVSPRREPVPAGLLPRVVDLYRADFERFDYPIP